MSDELLRQQAEQLLPIAVPDWQQNLTKPTNLYIAVRLPHKPFAVGETEDCENYLWFRGHGNLTIERIQKIVCERCETSAIVLRSASSSAVLGSELRVNHLNAKNLLVLIAMADDNSSKSSSGFNTAPSSPRPPLVPVNRQISAQPVQSPADSSKAISSPKSTTTPPTTIDSRISAVKPERSPGIPEHRTASISTPVRNEMGPDMVKREPYRKTFPNLKAEPKPEEQTVDPNLKAYEPSNEPQGQSKGEPSQPLMLEETENYVPRDQGNPFAASQEEETSVESSRGGRLRELTEETVPERLEAGVTVGLEIISEIEKPLKELGNEDAQNWLQQIARVKSEAVRNRTVVGVVGNTGAGKSSVINAMLDEERLVPTNCMRACTAVVTEMSYNDSSNPNSLYRAEIEFIRPEDWEKELHVLFSELFDENGNISREISNPDSEAGVAYAKIRAVYHKHTRDMLSQSSPAKLMRAPHVQKVLGATRRIAERDASLFYKRLQQYVDSKEKGTEKKDKNGKVIGERKRPFEMWPLIKVVKIYTKSEALATGAVIVDLPGVHDSNAARAAVAAGYMKQCTGLWIVAPINRAVDDKAAKTLLGDTFKRQLKFDGTYSAVTFICSKTDDISRTEAQDSLNLGDQMDDLEEKSVDIESRRRDLTRQMKEAKATKEDHEETLDQVEEQMETWESLEEDLERGKVVYPPVEKKRKRVVNSESPSNKRRRRSVDLDDSEDDRDRNEPGLEDSKVDEQAQRAPLTEDDISKKLDELKELRKEARREKRSLDDRLKGMRDELSKVDNELDAIEVAKTAICIKGRNEYSRGAIQQDFAAGIRELDQENAAEEDPDNFNPEEDMRDYDEVARTLPVFCVSSRAYQKLSGRLQKDNDVPGFMDAEQTEIPQLQEHCKKLTIKGRQANCRRFLNNLKSLLTSLGLWASDDGSGIKMTLQQRDAEKAFLTRKLKELERALEKTVGNTLEDAVETLNDDLFSKFQPAIEAAVGGAIPTAVGWGAHRNEGGLHWGTYKATVRRNGVFRNNFNDELAEPIYKTLATVWEKAFQRRLPNVLKAYQKSALNVLKQFHTAVEQRVRERGTGLARVMLLYTQLDSYKAIFGDLAQSAIEALNNGQRELNREFTPVIASSMEEAYEICAAERGTGSFKRMKAAMESHVEREKNEMFEAASEQVKDGLLRLCETIKTTMLDKADNVFVQLKRDYGGVVGLNTSHEVKMTREERAARREVDDLISAADDRFEGVLSTALDELKQELKLDETTEKAEANMEAEDDGFDDFQDDEEDANESDGEDSAAGNFVVPDEGGL